jgi:hypothetical protein
MNLRCYLLSVPLLAACLSSARAGDPAIPAPANPSRWKLGMGYAPVFGLKVEFGGLGRFTSPFTPQPIGGGTDYDYDDGFVHLDSSGNLGGTSWNWGYENDSQHDPSNGGTIQYGITNSLANGSAEERDNAAAGVEIFACYDMGGVNFGDLGNRGTRWGLRGGFHYAHVETASHDRVLTGLSTLNDVFLLGGVIPPLAPYAGSFGGPGPLIGDDPVRSVTNAGVAPVTGSRELDAHLSTLQFGAYLDLPVHPRVHMQFEAGLSAMVAAGKYHYNSATTITGLGTRNSNGRDSRTDVLAGIYLGFGAYIPVDDSWSLRISGRYQLQNDFDLGTNGSTASLSFGSAFQLSTAVVYSF